MFSYAHALNFRAIWPIAYTKPPKQLNCSQCHFTMTKCLSTSPSARPSVCLIVYLYCDIVPPNMYRMYRRLVSSTWMWMWMWGLVACIPSFRNLQSLRISIGTIDILKSSVCSSDENNAFRGINRHWLDTFLFVIIDYPSLNFGQLNNPTLYHHRIGKYEETTNRCKLSQLQMCYHYSL